MRQHAGDAVQLATGLRQKAVLDLEVDLRDDVEPAVPEEEVVVAVVGAADRGFDGHDAAIGAPLLDGGENVLGVPESDATEAAAKPAAKASDASQDRAVFFNLCDWFVRDLRNSKMRSPDSKLEMSYEKISPR